MPARTDRLELERAILSLKRVHGAGVADLLKALEAELMQAHRDHMSAAPDRHVLLQGRVRTLHEIVGRIRDAEETIASAERRASIIR